MNILSISTPDITGKRFNGYDNMPILRDMGHNSCMLVVNKQSKNIAVSVFTSSKLKKFLNSACSRIEKILGIQSVLGFAGHDIVNHEFYKKSDIVHAHLLHNISALSLLSLPAMMQQKATVWTLHDPWALTGHCVHPQDCTRWQTGCHHCQHLDWEFPVHRDATAFMWKLKQYIYKRCSCDIVVSSQWMCTMLANSPLFATHRIYKVPFGLSADVFYPCTMANFRSLLNIDKNAFLVFFRATDRAIKGWPLIHDALLRLQTKQPVHLLTVGDMGGLGELAHKYPVTELGWQQNDEILAAAYNAADVFLTPAHESFCMMALEALACGTPVICLKDSAVEELCQPPLAGISIPEHDTAALVEAIQRLIIHPEERFRLSHEAARLGAAYTQKAHVEQLLTVYAECHARFIKEHS